MTDKKNHFAIGCFHFSYSKPLPFKMKGNDYINDLKNALESITNISNLEIYCPDDYQNFSETITEIDSSFGLNLFPYLPTGSSIKFNIFIPERIQNELSVFGKKLYTEHFSVNILYTYFFPFTYIELINPSQDPSPSDSVAIIREFLQTQINKDNNSIKFEFLGPSPFHADFSLSTGDFKNSFEILECIPIKFKGYDSISFEYDPKIFNQISEAKEYFLDEVGDEFGLFYYITNGDVIRMYEWEKIQTLLDNLIELNKTRGLKYTWFRITQVYKLIQDITVILTEFEIYDIDFKFEINKELKNINRERSEGYLNEYLSDEINELRSYPTKQVKEVLNLIEDRRSKRIENLIALISALIGGIIGSLITLFFSKNA